MCRQGFQQQTSATPSSVVTPANPPCCHRQHCWCCCPRRCCCCCPPLPLLLLPPPNLPLLLLLLQDLAERRAAHQAELLWRGSPGFGPESDLWVSLSPSGLYTTPDEGWVQEDELKAINPHASMVSWGSVCGCVEVCPKPWWWSVLGWGRGGVAQNHQPTRVDGELGCMWVGEE